MLYRFALDRNNEIIDILALSKNRQPELQSFACIACGNPLIPRLGNIREKHFAHHPGAACSTETYLHKLAKEIFYRRYTFCLANKIPLFVKIDTLKTCDTCLPATGKACTFNQTPIVFGLAPEYNEISVEGCFGRLRADILLHSTEKKDYIAVEVKVAHSISQEKRESGVKIIEFSISSEADILRLSNRLEVNPIYDKGATFLNFEGLQKMVRHSRYSCPKDYKYIFLSAYADGRFAIQKKRLIEINEILTNNSSVPHYEIVGSNGGPLPFLKFARALREKGVIVKSCVLCAYGKIKSEGFYGDDYDPIIHCTALYDVRYPASGPPQCQNYASIES